MMNKQELLELFDKPLETLVDKADSLRKEHFAYDFNLCSINNVKSGKCSENCTYCAQSSHFTTSVPSYNLIESDSILSFAKNLEIQGVHRHSLVSSGRNLSREDQLALLPVYRELSNTNLSICASHGLLTYEQALLLRDAGVTRYHHNLETSENYYSSICTTHTFQDRVTTIKACKKAGLEVCSGGIWGLGETREDRIDMLLSLKSLDVNSIPINILTPIKGTPLENNPTLPLEEIMKTLAIYRICLPKKEIRLAAGRIQFKDQLDQVYRCGVNGILTGDYLTTTGFTVAKDKETLQNLGFKVSLSDHC